MATTLCEIFLRQCGSSVRSVEQSEGRPTKTATVRQCGTVLCQMVYGCGANKGWVNSQDHSGRPPRWIHPLRLCVHLPIPKKRLRLLCLFLSIHLPPTHPSFSRLSCSSRGITPSGSVGRHPENLVHKRCDRPPWPFDHGDDEKLDWVLTRSD